MNYFLSDFIQNVTKISVGMSAVKEWNIVWLMLCHQSAPKQSALCQAYALLAEILLLDGIKGFKVATTYMLNAVIAGLTFKPQL